MNLSHLFVSLGEKMIEVDIEIIGDVLIHKWVLSSKTADAVYTWV